MDGDDACVGVHLVRRRLRQDLLRLLQPLADLDQHLLLGGDGCPQVLCLDALCQRTNRLGLFPRGQRVALLASGSRYSLNSSGSSRGSGSNGRSNSLASLFGAL